ncbi:MAG TPA: NAD/NADP octopine/nopaline dehydrogenase [Firmicutes bacterium]|nr:NAD/NADP octopine/nopaline dehydrogenase [Bacillota bacterium]
MNISVLGAGNGGTAVAAELSLQGHEVTLIKTSNAMHDQNFNFLLEHSGVVNLIEKEKTVTARIKHITRDLSHLSESEVVIVYIQTNYHEDLIKRIKRYLRDGQILLLNPGYLSTAYVLKHCSDIDLTICEAQSSFLDCRISEPGTIRIGFRNVRNPLGIYPVSRIKESQEILNKLGFPFVYLPSVIEAALHNPNLIVHTIGAIMSIPRIEKTKGDYCMYHEVFTPSVWRILEVLDSEKMDVMDKLGCKRVSYVEACKYRNTLDDSRDAKEVFFWYANMPTRAKGPVAVDSRYISEDVPQGLVLLETLGLKLNVETPICTALINIASASLGRNLRLEGRTVERLGEDMLERILQDKEECSELEFKENMLRL